jgi:hypothetical protein
LCLLLMLAILGKRKERRPDSLTVFWVARSFPACISCSGDRCQYKL